MFFEPIIKWAVEILENVEQCALKPSDVYRHPVITVSVLLILKLCIFSINIHILFLSYRFLLDETKAS